MAMTMVDGDCIIKARNDKREYRRVVLENSLEALLISDPDTDKCAASMDVGVGHFSDPQGIEGLAHFLEHMLFYASEKYPEEESFAKYTSQHGGETNAFTDSDSTNYHFVANADCFEEALDRFSQFFVKPLMSPDAVQREIQAVDSEFQMNFLSDSWRISQLQRHLSMEGHPYRKFGTGNGQTLEVQPKAKGIDIRQELIKFYEENYSANLMRLVVYGKGSLDKIQDLVVEKFQAICNNNQSCFHISGHPCLGEHLQVLVKAVPVCDVHMLQIQWPMPATIHHYKEAPCSYLTHLIEHEGEGSLFHALKRLGWATGLYACESYVDSNSSFFDVVIGMTDAGHEHMQDIVGLLFKYIDILHQSSICEWIYDEVWSMDPRYLFRTISCKCDKFRILLSSPRMHLLFSTLYINLISNWLVYGLYVQNPATPHCSIFIIGNLTLHVFKLLPYFCRCGFYRVLSEQVLGDIHIVNFNG